MIEVIALSSWIILPKKNQVKNWIGAQTCSQSWSQLPRLHEEWKIPGDDLTANADGFMPCVAEEVASGRDNFSVILVGPSGVVTVTVDRQGQVSGVGDLFRK